MNGSNDYEIAWHRVYTLCIEGGMDINNADSGISNVLDYITRLASIAEAAEGMAWRLEVYRDYAELIKTQRQTSWPRRYFRQRRRRSAFRLSRTCTAK